MEEKAVMLDKLQAESLLEIIVFFRQEGGVTEWGEFEELRILSEAIAKPFGLKPGAGLTQSRPQADDRRQFTIDTESLRPAPPSVFDAITPRSEDRLRTFILPAQTGEEAAAKRASLHGKLAGVFSGDIEGPVGE